MIAITVTRKPMSEETVAANVILSYMEDPQQESGRRVVFESCSDLSDASRFFKQVRVSE